MPHTLAELLTLSLRLSAAERKILSLALNDWEEIHASVNYIDNSPALLRSSINLDNFYQGLGERWGISPQAAQDLCQAGQNLSAGTQSAVAGAELETGSGQQPSGSSPPSPGPSEAEKAEIIALRSDVAARLSRLLGGGKWTLTTVARDLREQGMSIARTGVNKLSQNELANGIDLLALRQIQQRIGSIEQQEKPDKGSTPSTSDGETELTRLREYIAALQDQINTQNSDPQEIRRYVTQMQHAHGDAHGEKLLQQSSVLLRQLSDDQLLELLTLDYASATVETLEPYLELPAEIEALTELLHIRAITKQYQDEVARLTGLGWSQTRLNQHLGGFGFELGKDGPSDAPAAQALLPHLRRLHHAPPPSHKKPVAKQPLARPADGSLVKDKERLAYVDQLIQENGVVYTNDLALPFGMRGSSVSPLLKEAGYTSIGGGGYRARK